MSKTDIVSVTGLSKTFGKVEALKEFTLDIEAGIFGPIGPNGAGKTTLIRVLLGLIHADAGQANVLGMNVRTHSLDIRRRIGVLHERPSFTPTISTLDYLQCVKQIYRSQSDPKELLATVGLEDAHDRKIMNLSAGMHQRLGIAQALIGSPELVFLDEPTSNLDVVGRDEIIKLIVDLNLDLGVSFFIASHILSELERACQTVAFIREGIPSRELIHIMSWLPIVNTVPIDVEIRISSDITTKTIPNVANIKEIADVATNAPGR